MARDWLRSRHFPAVIRNRVLPLLFAARGRGRGGIGVCRGGAEPAGVGRADRAVRGLRLAARAVAIAALGIALLATALRAAEPQRSIAPPRCSPRRCCCSCWRRPGRRRRRWRRRPRRWPGSRSAPAFWVLAGAAALAIIDSLQRAARRDRRASRGRRHPRRRVRGHGARPGCSTRCRWRANTAPARRRSPPR